ncbi:helix-turn-helix domain-containing protein [Streptomyces gardneri]|uniref:helix-turn-helix domain-containing protein n=1 Tax=Streptomyces gardneri TaxID=66892 RepID=UPI0038B5A567
MAAYGARLRRLREERGWKQEDLAARTSYSGKHVSAVESARRSPTLKFSREIDSALGVSGTAQSFEREWRKMRDGVFLEGFPEYVHYERQAVEIRMFDIGVVPGLFQTIAYAEVLAAFNVERGSVRWSVAPKSWPRSSTTSSNWQRARSRSSRWRRSAWERGARPTCR